MIVIVGGVPGAGKSTVLTNFKRIVEEEKKLTVKLVNYGTVMFEEARKRGVKHRDEMRRMPIPLQREIQKLAAERISSISGDLIIVDTHFSIRTSYGYLPGIPSYVADKLSPTHLVVVKASPEEIMSRRMQDADRRRDLVTTSEIIEELNTELFYAVSVSNYTGAPLIVIDNKQGKAEEASREMITKLGL